MMCARLRHLSFCSFAAEQVETLTQEGWDFALSHRELVFARATPEQKLLLVREAMKRGERGESTTCRIKSQGNLPRL
jgi:hypothetical protein